MHLSMVLPLDHEAMVKSMNGRVTFPKTDPDGVRRHDNLLLLPTQSGCYNVPDGEPAPLAADERKARGAMQMLHRRRARERRVRAMEPPGQVPAFCRGSG